jgi:hypothetical protein
VALHLVVLMVQLHLTESMLLAGLISLVLIIFMDMETNMTKIQKVLIINAATGEQELREMNADELSQVELDKAADEVKNQIKADKAAAAASAIAKLEAIGLTPDEIAALRG